MGFTSHDRANAGALSIPSTMGSRAGVIPSRIYTRFVVSPRGLPQVSPSEPAMQSEPTVAA